MRKSAVLVGAAATVIGLAALLVPALTDKRQFHAAIPQPPAVTRVALIVVPEHAQACMAPAVIDHQSEVAVIRVGTYGKPAVPLVFTASARGYDVSDGVMPTYRDNDSIAIPVRPPAHATVATVCVANEGPRRIALYASDDRTKFPSTTLVSGRPVGANFWLSFYQRQRHSLLSQLPLIFDHLQAFRPGVLGPWLFWPLAILSLLGVPAGVIYAFYVALRPD
jgi:hypothetical protein